MNHCLHVFGFLQALAKKLCGFKGKFHAFKGDLEKEEDIKAVFEWTESNLKSPVHVLVNNAGFASIDTMLSKSFVSMLQVVCPCMCEILRVYLGMFLYVKKVWLFLY